MKKMKKMRPLSIMVLCASLASLVATPPAAQAQPSSGSLQTTINPYICDVDNNPSDNNYTVYVHNDHKHVVLTVQSVANNATTYYCNNAGGFAQLSRPVPFHTISALVKTTGTFTPADVFVELYVNNNPQVFYFDATTARVGPTVDGYTRYTWVAKDLAGLTGFPSNPVLTEFGFSVNIYTIGSGSITTVRLNSSPVSFGMDTILTCPFSNPAQCNEVR